MTEQADSLQQPDALERWVERLLPCHLPLLSDSAQVLSGLRLDSGIPIDRLCGALPGDPGAVLEILRRANAHRHRSLGSRVSTLENAAQMLGVRQLQLLPRDLTIIDPARAGPTGRDYLQLVSRSYHAGLQAYRWARYRGDRVPREVYLAAMLHDLGELMLCLHGGAEELKRIRDLERLERMPADEAQYVVLGFSLEQLSYGLAVRWNLPELLLQSLEPEYAQQPRVLGVMLAAQMARLCEAGWYGGELVQCIDNTAAWIEVSADDLIPHIHSNAVEAARDVEHLGVWPAARRLPMLPGEEPEEDRAPAAHQDEVAPVHFCLMPQRNLYDELVAGLECFVPGDLSLHDLMTKVMRGLHDGLGLNRVVFAMLSRDRSTLQARYMAGTDNDPGFNRFKLQMEPPHLFSRLLEREQAVWVNEDNYAKLWPLVPEPVRRLIQTDTFFSASVVVDGKPIGLFYADRHLPDSRLDPRAYQRFKHLCQLSAQAIARLRNH